MSYIITEMQNGEEIEVFESNDYFRTIKWFNSIYTEQDKQNLSPCVYKRLANGDLTTEY